MHSTIDPIELERLLALNHFESLARQAGYRVIAGVDEAGRGPLAGPVVAAACIIPEGFFFQGIDDSKKLSQKERERLFQAILSDQSIFFGVGIVPHTVIDEINIYQATQRAMFQAIENLKQKPDYLLVDGMNLSHPEIDSLKIIKGDAKSQSIAAASVIAKETRDKIMMEYHAQWPEYGFDRHKGYLTAYHTEALKKHGPCPIHRMSFEPIKSKLSALASI